MVSLGLLTMYITHAVGTAVSLPCYNTDWQTLQSHGFNMPLCIIYKAHYNLAMSVLLDYATPATFQTSNLSCYTAEEICSSTFLPITLK